MKINEFQRKGMQKPTFKFLAETIVKVVFMPTTFEEERLCEKK